MKKNLLILALALFSFGVVFFGSSSFGSPPIEEEGTCSGDACLQGYNPSTGDSTYYKTDFVTGPPFKVCCANDCIPDESGCDLEFIPTGN
ncbi:MAG: hypothetical protein HN352_14540 [Bacteroidetes bacterium]|jgi:hypothetical protein|nr:hypothetical protein [Bacteroidota bacterium]MBT3750675.1 hypothetical protein [Bacteroidota bacterium]MBT4401890.1 hypothetical protein [Bacteroidota bacterium]MBT4408420.1 hypothetical protein [Bacteroidota bacterium]MBT4970055.1 hypothetical protein [Bacteroidota bacterium]